MTLRRHKENKKMRPRANPQCDRCTGDDYRGLFAADADQIQWLCRTLTGDENRARLCFEGALDRLLETADGVFREWMSSWTRRVVIKTCISAMRTEIRRAALGFAQSTLNESRLDAGISEHLPKMPPEILQEELLALDVLSRFVLVLRAMEGYSRRETALLLDVDEMTCAAAQSSAASIFSLANTGSGLAYQNAAMTA